MKRKLLICVQRDITNQISWALKELDSISVQMVDRLYQLEKIFEDNPTFPALVIDSFLDGQSTIPFLKKIREKNINIKILLIISQDTPKQEVVTLIQNRLVDNVIIRPFNANQIVDAVSKIFGIQRFSEKPWYMYVKKD
jgi:DNA-binding NtrC family response regulator